MGSRSGASPSDFESLSTTSSTATATATATSTPLFESSVLGSILADARAARAFLRHMRHVEHLEEAVEFLLDVEYYRYRCPAYLLVETAQTIYSTYIDERSSTRLDLPPDIRATLGAVEELYNPSLSEA